MVLLYILLCALLFSLNISWSCFLYQQVQSYPVFFSPTEQLFLVEMYHSLFILSTSPLMNTGCSQLCFSISAVNILIVACFVFVGQFPHSGEQKGLYFGKCCQIALYKDYTTLPPVVYENANCPTLLPTPSVVRL